MPHSQVLPAGAASGRSGALSVPIRGGALHGECHGEGMPVVLIHGFSLDLRMWDWQVPDLVAAGYRVIRYDLRGFGRSTLPGPEPYSHADDLCAVLDAAGIRRAALVGLSLGANVACACALEHPDRVAALVLASSGLPGHPWREERPPEAAEAHARRHGIEAGRRFWLAHPLFESVRARPDAAAALDRMVGEYSGWHWANPNPQRPPPRVAERLPEIEVPALVLTGEHDVAGYREIGDVLAAGMPRARRVRLPEVGHMMNMEDPALFNRTVLAFLAEAGNPAR